MKPLDSATGIHRSAVRKVLAAGRRERGAAVVEFAVLVPVLLLLVLGVADFGLAMNTYNNETQLANEGARWAVVDKNPGSGSLQAYIKSRGDTAQIRNNATVCITFPGSSANIGDPVLVTVSVNYTFLQYLRNVLPGHVASKAIAGSATMRLEQIPTHFSAGCTS